jgi:hypothetical protein
VRVNDRLEVNPILQIGDVTETVNVTAESPLLETASASGGQISDARRVAALPIAHGEPCALMATTTGAAFTGDPALYVPPTDILAEMKVQTAAFDASVGQTEGGVVSLSLKAGPTSFTKLPTATSWHRSSTPTCSSPTAPDSPSRISTTAVGAFRRRAPS